MIRRPPTSTPCPCTALFRSRGPRHPPPGPAIRHPGIVAPGLAPRSPCSSRLPLDEPLLAHLEPADVGLQPQGRPLEQDRKSTRLNSSHANTSNAVFCLQKNH